MTEPAAALPRETEVVVVGGGIVGCATAFFLAEAGVPVALFEKGRIAGEQSSRNWGWVRKQGRDPLELPAIIESLRIWQGLEARLGADLGWHQGGVTYLARSEAEVAKFEAWLAHARTYQLDSRLLSSAETDALLGQDQRRWPAALSTPGDGRAEPSKAAPALAAATYLIHGWVDFSLQIPGLFLLFAVLLGLAWGAGLPRRRSPAAGEWALRLALAAAVSLVLLDRLAAAGGGLRIDVSRRS